MKVRVRIEREYCASRECRDWGGNYSIGRKWNEVEEKIIDGSDVEGAVKSALASKRPSDRAEMAPMIKEFVSVEGGEIIRVIAELVNC